MPRESMKAWDDARKAREADPNNPKLIDAEYDAEREHFRRVEKTRRWRRGIVYLLVVTAFSVLTWLAAEQQSTLNDTVDQVQELTEENRELTTSLQAAIVESCERIGNERAKVSREQIHEEIFDAQHPDQELIDALNLPPEKIDELIAKQVETLRDRLSRIKLTDCAAQYQISPGSGDRRRGRLDSSSP